MALTYSTAVKNARLQAVADAIDAGATGGLLKIWTVGLATLLVTITLPKPCAAVASGVLTFSGLPVTALASGNGTAAAATICDSAGTVVISGLSVGLSASDVIVSDTAVSSSQEIDLIAVSQITHG